MSVQVSTLQAEDIDGAITCIQEAFAADPYFQWVFDKVHFSLPRNRASLRTRCLWGMKHALFHVAKDPSSTDPHRVLGVGCWLPPGLAKPAASSLSTPQHLLSYFSLPAWQDYLSQQASSWSLWVAQLTTNIRFRGRGGLNVQRYHIWKAAQASAQSVLWTDPEGYWFCNIITVLPEAQGKGIGRRLVEEVTKRADGEGRRCYLESSTRVPNVEIYERLGFELRREMECKPAGSDEGITLFCMIREPQ